MTDPASPDPVLFDTAQITAIDPLEEAPHRASIRVGKKNVGVLPLSVIHSLKIQVGTAWSLATSATVAQAVRFDEALADAMHGVDKKALSRSQLQTKLIEKGYEPSIVEAVSQRMIDLGAIDDRALAEALIAEAKKKTGVGPAMLKEKLLKRGIPESIADQLLDADDGAQEDALSFATKKLATMKRLDPTTQRRRLWGMLARRGFEESLVAQVVETLLGLPEEPGEMPDEFD